MSQTEIAAFAAGCFWGTEEAFRKVKGVISTAVGYMGGTTVNPHYEQVCTGITGHAETVYVEFDPLIVKYSELLEIFWRIHDPTSFNRQGVDVGTQYRSAIFYYSTVQRDSAYVAKKSLSKTSLKPIVTEIVPATIFYKAEEYHQQYLDRQRSATCRL